MKETIFSLAETNPNHRVLMIPQEEGGTDDDHYSASIGDATQKHVGSLNQNERQLWEGLYAPNSGNIFRSDSSPAWNDPDPFNLSGEDLEDYFEKLKKTAKNGGLNDSDIAPLREAIEQEQERRAKSEDLYDRAESIPYHMLQLYPNMTQHAEIPATPKDHMTYMGNTNQMFYDYFVEEHPNAKQINDLLRMLNRDLNTIDEGYAEWFKDHLGYPLREEVSANFNWLVDRLVDGRENPVDLVEQVLTGIENVWRKEWIERAKEKAKEDSILQLLKLNRKYWSEESKKGYVVFGSIKKFGQMLFNNFQGKIKKHHWDLYREIKKEYTPKVLIRNIDINHCGMEQLHFLFEDKAKDVWFKRPFNSVEDVRKNGYLTRKVFVDDDQSEYLITKIEKIADNGLVAFESLRKHLIEAQKKRTYGKINWAPIWNYYFILKNELTRKEQDNGR
jgi:hypothetical protein